MTWVYDLPGWLVAAIFVGGFGTVAAAGLLLVWRVMPASDREYNDVAGPIISTIGVVLAVMLSFMVVTVWQEYDQAASVVNTEAGEIADLYHEASALPEPQRSVIRSGLRTYVTQVVNIE